MSDSSSSENDAPHLDLDQLVHHTELPQTRLSRAIDRILGKIGEWSSWLWVVLVGVITANVTLRYVFGEGFIQFEELQWHVYAVGFLIGLSYCYVSDDHVRIDVLHEHFKLRTQAWIELFGILIFLLPFVLLVVYYSLPFIAYSWSIGEVSEAPGGLPLRWFIKSFLFIGSALLGLATLARLVRVTALLFGVPRPLPRPKE